MDIEIKTLPHFDTSFGLPSYATSGASGIDIRAALGLGNDLTIKPFERVLVPTGFCISIPKGFELQIRPRSGLSLKTGLVVVNSPGTIDSDYRGEIKIIMSNFSYKDEIIRHGDRVAQMVLAKVEIGNFVLIENLSESDRSSGGFGSTGVQ